MSPKLELIIFDMDGVLVDSENQKRRAFERCAFEYGIEGGGDYYISTVGILGLQRAQRFVAEKGLIVSPEGLDRRWDQIYKEILVQEGPIPIDSSINFLKSLQSKWRTALASSQPTEKVNLNLERLGLLQYFDYVVAGEDAVSRQKPHPDIFIYAAGMARIPTFNCLVIEDLEQGIQAAKEAGMRCAVLKREHNKFQNLSRANYAVDDLNQLNLKVISESF